MAEFVQAQGPRSRGLAIARKIDRLEALSRQRPLTDAEAGELQRLLYAQRQRQQRIPLQIAACEAKLLKLRSELAAIG